MDAAFTSFVLGYHGCDRAVAERVFAGDEPLRPSRNDYDWLADGVYFWEHNARRAYELACQRRDGPRGGRDAVVEPAVVGAVIDPGNCLNLLDSRYVELVRLAYGDLSSMHAGARTPIPANTLGPDLLLRRLDCEVIRTVHRERQGGNLVPFDTVRAAFVDGGPLYPNAGFAARNHIQLCVRNPACVKGYFRPLGPDGRPIDFG